MARPTKYNEKIANHLLDLLRQGHSFRDACFGVGISEDTLIRWRKSDPDFAEQVDSAKNQYWSSESLKKYHTKEAKKWQNNSHQGINTHPEVGKALETALNAPEGHFKKSRTYLGLPVRYELPEEKVPNELFYYAREDAVQFYDYNGVRHSCPSDLWSAEHSASLYGDEWSTGAY